MQVARHSQVDELTGLTKPGAKLGRNSLTATVLAGLSQQPAQLRPDDDRFSIGSSTSTTPWAIPQAMPCSGRFAERLTSIVKNSGEVGRLGG